MQQTALIDRSDRDSQRPGRCRGIGLAEDLVANGGDRGLPPNQERMDQHRVWRRQSIQYGDCRG